MWCCGGVASQIIPEVSSMKVLKEYNDDLKDEDEGTASSSSSSTFSTASIASSASSASSATSAYHHYPQSHDREAYTGATPPSPITEIQGLCDANWGSQIGGTVADGEEIGLFKYRSMSGYLIMCCGGPIRWKAVCQECTSPLHMRGRDPRHQRSGQGNPLPLPLLR